MRNFILLFSFIANLLSGCSNGSIKFSAGELDITVDQKGFIRSLESPLTGLDYLPLKTAAPLMQIRVNGTWFSPSKFTPASEANQYLLAFVNGYEAKINIAAPEGAAYVTFTLLEIKLDSVDLVQWGPYPTTIGETIGETIGVVRNEEFAIGIQALNIKTLGGYPSQESDIDPAYDIFESGNIIDVADSVKVFYRGQSARKETFGSVLQAYCRNRSQERIIENWGHEFYVAPAFEDGGVNGSSIALFGCPPNQVLPTISGIEIDHGLPHPMIDNEWAKTSRKATAAYVITSFGVDNFEDMLDLVKKAGLSYLYHEGPFKNWVHFDLNEKQFPENWETMKLMVNRAAEEKITLGVHTLSNFITTNDPYVTPVPDLRLARVGESKLTGDINAIVTEIPIEDPRFFNQMKNNTLHAVLIGNEIVRYASVSESEPWMLTGCERGAFGTAGTVHEAGSVIAKLMDHPYQTLLTNAELSMEVSDQIAAFFNFTGCGQISFDGLEGNWSTGMGQYGRQLFTQNWYDKLSPELKGKVITDASNPGHFFWHSFTRMNWGEPWYAGFRESQTQYRLLNQLYFARNYIPPMLGWFKMTPETSIEDIQWLLARSAGFNAGYAMVTSPSTVATNGFGEKLLSLIREWEAARMADAFPEDIRKDLRDIAREFHLEADGPNGWMLYPFEIWRTEHKKVELQPGQPNLTRLELENPNPDQPLQFLMTAMGQGEASLITITIDGARKSVIPVTLKAGEHLRYTGGSYVGHYDQRWTLIEEFRVIQDDLTLTQGDHSLVFECQFSGTGESSVKIEAKTAGLGMSLKNSAGSHD